MLKTYQFYCKKCKLLLTLYKGNSKGDSKEKVNFYCFNCHKISYHNKCNDCGEKLYFIIEIPQERQISALKEGTSLKLNLECMRCKSEETELILIREWD